MTDKTYITYENFGELADELCNRLSSSDKKFSAVYGLPRGGLSLAVHVSFKMEIPLIMNLTQFNKEFPKGRLLIVDDIIGIGKGYERALEFCEIRNIKCSTAVLFCRSESNNKPDFYIDESSSWIVFPWDKIDIPVDDYQRQLYVETFKAPEELVFKSPN